MAETADAIAAQVLAVPGVAGLHAGRFGEVATYLPGRRVTGVKLGEDRVEVHVVLLYSAPLLAVAQRIHAVVAAVVEVPVQVFVEDLSGPKT
ncbi:Asp23/Gls24 family envelope stress response protein [Kineococcus rubinsiae]|uniref:Asp23/Gls24 family envelope stress response protein n=1 Tax=Kineococcus rubinsiae TaxID=2609562 RepID=UPI0014306595|nr:Asp23/Gls24 family envelope stress response protein [Kineococcus rubinsiae]